MSVDVQTALRSPKSYDLARTALEVMEAHQVWPTVRNFELWVHYVAEKESPLAQEIDRLLAAGEPITETMGAELAALFLPEAKLNGDILEAGDVLSKELRAPRSPARNTATNWPSRRAACRTARTPARSRLSSRT
jgi:diguanylate cyclase